MFTSFRWNKRLEWRWTHIKYATSPKWTSLEETTRNKVLFYGEWFIQLQHRNFSSSSFQRSSRTMTIKVKMNVESNHKSQLSLFQPNTSGSLKNDVLLLQWMSLQGLIQQHQPRLQCYILSEPPFPIYTDSSQVMISKQVWTYNSGVISQESREKVWLPGYKHRIDGSQYYSTNCHLWK